MKDEKVILIDSPEAAQYKTDIEGWVSADGFFFGKDERLARYKGCTHVKCQKCGNPCEKGWLVCDNCREKSSIETYNALPYVKWDGKTRL